MFITFAEYSKMHIKKEEGENRMKKFLCLVAVIALLTGCASKKEEVKREETIVIGLDDTFAPMGFRDESGKLVGFDVDLAKAIGEKLGMSVEFQPIDWAMKETELNGNNIDCIWNGYSITEARKEMVEFSNPYLQNKQIIITLSESSINSKEDLANKKVAVQKESSALEAVQQDSIVTQLSNLIEFDTNIDCFLDLEAGRSDAIVCDEVLARYVMKQRGEEKYKVLSDNFGEEEYGIGFRKADTELVEKVNRALQECIDDGTVEQIRMKWFAQ